MKITPVAASQNSQPAPVSKVQMQTQTKSVADILSGAQAEQAVQATPTVEAPKAEVTQEKPLSPQHLALARKEKALRDQQLKLKQEQEAWRAEQGNYITKEQLKANALKTLEEAGIKYEDLVQQQLESTSNLDPVQAKIAELESKLQGLDKKEVERTQADYQQALRVIEGDVKLLVDSDPQYETIKARGQQKEVVNLIEQVFNTEGTILSVEEAARLVEDTLLDMTLKEMQRLNQIKKIQAKLTPAPAPQVTEEAQMAPKGPSKTLTNAMSSVRQLSARERAILAFNGQLKK